VVFCLPGFFLNQMELRPTSSVNLQFLLTVVYTLVIIERFDDEIQCLFNLFFASMQFRGMLNQLKSNPHS
jgi:hypothetical protein